jgi:ATP-dependent Lon protease
MFKSLAVTPLAHEDSEELIQLINPDQESDLKPEDLPDELSTKLLKSQR